VSYLLDTSVCVAVLRGNEVVGARVRAEYAAGLAVSAITLAELWHGALKSAHPVLIRAEVDHFLGPLVMFPFEESAADAYAGARTHLEARGTPIGERDLLIAATALAHGMTVVTMNTREFGRVPGLAVEDWSA
jgi:tRNA(fMet)-specific endonuclease VapC